MQNLDPVSVVQARVPKNRSKVPFRRRVFFPKLGERFFVTNGDMKPTPKTSAT